MIEERGWNRLSPNSGLHARRKFFCECSLVHRLLSTCRPLCNQPVALFKPHDGSVPRANYGINTDRARCSPLGFLVAPSDIALAPYPVRVLLTVLFLPHQLATRIASKDEVVTGIRTKPPRVLPSPSKRHRRLRINQPGTIESAPRFLSLHTNYLAQGADCPSDSFAPSRQAEPWRGPLGSKCLDNRPVPAHRLRGEHYLDLTAPRIGLLLTSRLDLARPFEREK